MKQLAALLLVLLSLSACKKGAATSPEIIIEPPVERRISSDTLTSGQQWGLTIGQASADLYAKIQEIRLQKQISYLGVVGNVFTNLEGLENKIPLYSSISLDEKRGTSTGIQISFAENKVKSIFTNNGISLNSWPTGSGILLGDKIEDIYQKLVAIKKTNYYASKFERISIFFKDVNKAYDAQMSLSPQWYFVAPLDSKKYNIVQLNFTAGKLVSIYSAVFERQ
jgi:hypothetical protein